MADAGSVPWKRSIRVLIAIGIALRVHRFLENPALWFDEAALACNVLDRDFAQLLEPLDDAQVAPFGFTALTKALTLVFGDSEYVLRALPLLAGIAALFLFTRAARALLRPGAVPIAVGLFALSRPLIRYSAEVKQYSTDAATALVLLLLALRTWRASRTNTPSLRSTVGFGVIGAAGVWLSLPSVFVLAGLGSTLLVAWWRAGRMPAVRRFAIAVGMWLVSFGLLYWLVLRHALAHEFLADFWGGSDEPGSPEGGTFMPLPPVSVTDLLWFGRAFLGLFTDLAGLGFAGIGALAFVAGATTPGYATGRLAIPLLLSPLLLALLASAFGVYPFYGRLLLFALPGLLLVIAAGAGAVVALGRGRTVAPGIALLALLFIHPVSSAVAGILRSRPGWDARTAVRQIASSRRPGDVVYVYYGGQTQMRYYARRVGMSADDYTLGVCSRDDWTAYERDLDRLGHPSRLWVMLSHYLPDERAFFVEQLDRRGVQLDASRSGHVHTYLYDFSGR